MRLSHMLLRKFHQKTSTGISETLAVSDDSTKVIILNLFVAYIGVSWAESYSAELQNYLVLLLFFMTTLLLLVIHPKYVK